MRHNLRTACGMASECQQLNCCTNAVLIQYICTAFQIEVCKDVLYLLQGPTWARMKLFGAEQDHVYGCDCTSIGCHRM